MRGLWFLFDFFFRCRLSILALTLAFLPVPQINHLSEGMRIGLTDKVEKHSDALGRDAVFSLQSRVKRLPRYLCIQVIIDT